MGKCRLQRKFEDPSERNEFYKSKPVEAVIDRTRRVLSDPPLEILATSLVGYREYDDAIKRLFTAYDDFLGMLADETPLPNGKTRRMHLDTLPADSIAGDAVASHARDLSHRFRDAIAELFLNPDTGLGRLTIEYGVF